MLDLPQDIYLVVYVVTGLVSAAVATPWVMLALWLRSTGGRS